MKKKLKIFLLLLLLAIIGFLINIQFGLSTQYNYFSAKSDISKGKIQLISVGTLMFDENIISKKYGFRIVDEGCGVLLEEENGIKQYNKVVKKFLVDKYGKDWEVKYNAECDSLIKIFNPNFNRNN